MDQADKYFEALQRYQELATRLVEKGGAYLVVIASHELYRFLYPYEPYQDFYNEDPVNFILKKIEEVNTFLETSEKSICFYSFDLDATGSILSDESSVEKKTSDVYTSLWRQFDEGTVVDESRALVKRRIPESIIENCIKGSVVLDMGCGSGRYSVALSLLGAKKVYGVDLFSQSYEETQKIVKQKGLDIEFMEANFHQLPFEENTFDFIFCNGTIHHSTSIEKSLSEYHRVLKPGKRGFLYIYAANGIFWKTRVVMREIFKNIPIEYTNSVLKIIGMPSNRFIFSDVWHVPIETHTTRQELETMLKKLDFSFEKLISSNPFDLDFAISKGIKNAEAMWGDGEHRYLLGKK